MRHSKKGVSQIYLVFSILAALNHVNGARVTSMIQSQATSLSTLSGASSTKVVCQTFLENLLNDNDMKNNPTQVLLNFEEQFCHSQSDQFQKAVIPYFCYYTGLNLINSISALTDQTKKSSTIFSFCETFGDGYQQRKRLISKVYMDQDQESFNTKCVDFYDYNYDKDLSKFDPLDMSDRLESFYFCDSLFKMIQVLKTHKKDQLADIIRYSYIMSLQTFIETYQANDYGRCEEIEAQKDTFCSDFFEWRSDFALWTAKQSQQICGKVTLSAKEQPDIQDMCAYTITRVYGMYNQYMNKILDNILSKEIQALNQELDKQIQSQHKKEEQTQVNLDKITKWLDELKVKSEQETRQKDIQLLNERLREIQIEKAQKVKAIDSILSFLDDLKDAKEQKEYKEMESNLKDELKNLGKEEEKIINNTQPETIKIIEQRVDQFIEDVEKQKGDDAINQMKEAVKIFDDNSSKKVVDFLQTLIDQQEYNKHDNKNKGTRDTSVYKNQYSSAKEVDRSKQETSSVIDSNPRQEINLQDNQNPNVSITPKLLNQSKFSFGDLEQVLSFLDKVILKMNLKTYKEIKQQVVEKERESKLKDIANAKEKAADDEEDEDEKSQIKDTSDSKQIFQENLKKVLKFLDDAIIRKSQKLKSSDVSKVEEFIESIYNNYDLNRKNEKEKEQEQEKVIEKEKDKEKEDKNEKVENSKQKEINEESKETKKEQSVESKIEQINKFLDKAEEMQKQKQKSDNNKSKKKKINKKVYEEEDDEQEEEEEDNDEEEEVEKKVISESKDVESSSIVSDKLKKINEFLDKTIVNSKSKQVKDHQKNDTPVAVVEKPTEHTDKKEDTSSAQIVANLQKVNQFIDYLFEQEQFNKKLQKVEDFIDKQIKEEKIDSSTLKEVKSIVTEEAKKDDTDTQLKKVLDFIDKLIAAKKNDESKVKEQKQKTDTSERQREIDSLIKEEKNEESKDNEDEEEEEEEEDEDEEEEVEDEGEEEEEEEDDSDDDEVEEVVEKTKEKKYGNKQKKKVVDKKEEEKIEQEISNISDLSDLRDFLTTMIRQTSDDENDSDKKEKLQQLRDVIDEYSVKQKQEKVDNFLDQLIKKNAKGRVAQAKLSMNDVSAFINDYEKQLVQSRVQTKASSKIEDEEDNFSFLLDDFDKIKNK
ncbi:UNKNOWN [Stylonychia lemnae]|uniref:Uncharacterized protein n=1 Tax=Stylonychia lemnae TaxID=5949 RepID=A0A077ZTG2_STYLE|nr:UNKNOWN [Stylonychia lemnae]|eukprot:CDW72804.1 UNKNOWN [Stylonychia lemnae]